MVWILWSLKESTYKAYQRIQINRGFYPQKIKIKSLEIKDSIALSKLELFGIDFFGKTIIASEWIHSIVTTKVSEAATDFMDKGGPAVKVAGALITAAQANKSRSKKKKKAE